MQTNETNFRIQVTTSEGTMFHAWFTTVEACHSRHVEAVDLLVKA